jgi:hypothetical protein
MGVSRTPKKSRNNVNKNLMRKATQQAQGEAMAELLVRLVSHWSLEQVNALSKQSQFVCIETGKNQYRVGKFNLLQQHENSWLVTDLEQRRIHDFYVKQAAVFYCLYETQAKFTKSAEFLDSDRELGNIAQEVIQLTENLQRARRKSDSFAIDLYLARLSYARPLLETLQTNMQKTITAAKYSKHVWEKNHETARYSYKTNIS